MSNLIFTFLTIICFLCHLPLKTSIRRGQVRESFCTGWCIDLLFSLCGTVISFALYHYDLWPNLTWEHIILPLLYLLLGLLLLLLAPSGLGLLRSRPPAPEILLAAEYRFNDTLKMVRGFLMILLFGLPLCLQLLCNSERWVLLLTPFSETQLYGGFCFISFMILLPVSLRQSFFWLRHLHRETDDAEIQLLQQYRSRLHYRKRNYLL